MAQQLSFSVQIDEVIYWFDLETGGYGYTAKNSGQIVARNSDVPPNLLFGELGKVNAELILSGLFDTKAVGDKAFGRLHSDVVEGEIPMPGRVHQMRASAVVAHLCERDEDFDSSTETVTAAELVWQVSATSHTQAAFI